MIGVCAAAPPIRPGPLFRVMNAAMRPCRSQAQSRPSLSWSGVLIWFMRL